MSTAIRRRRGTTVEHATRAGLDGELTVDTDKKTVVVHDGATLGGFPLMRADKSPFGAALFWARDEKTQGTAAGGALSGGNDRVINTIKTNDIPGVSLASNVVTLPAGTYMVEASAPAYAVDGHKLALLNSSTLAILLEGPSYFCYSTATADVVRAEVFGRIVVPAGGITVMLRHYVNTSKVTNGLGVQINRAGLIEVYTDIKIWRVA